MNMINARDISFSYEAESGSTEVLRHVNITAKKGELIGILGRNGCGKSTLVRHLNALLPLQSGELHVAGLDVREDKNCYELRRRCGMVFQNPDNQFVSSVIEEDIAFGLENYEVPEEEIPPRVQKALREVGMEGFQQRSPQMLSGGQKQRVALAGVLAMEPEVLVFDEATAMLDPEGRGEILALAEKLRGEGKTVVMISHYVEEALTADRVYLMQDGGILASGTPREILTNPQLLQQAGLLPTLPVRLYHDLLREGIRLPFCPLTEEELCEVLACR